MAMMDDTYERLMQDELEGTARPEDSARLRAHLAADAGARARFEELRLVFQVLGQVEMAEAPAGIREHVLRAIATDPVRRAGWLSDLRAAFARRPALTFTYSFAGGALAATIVFALVTGRVMLPGPGEAPVTGTMAPVAGRESLLDRGVLEVAGARVDVRWRRLPDGFEAVVQARSPRPTSLSVRFEGPSLSPVSFERTGPLAGRVELDRDRIDIEGSGDLGYVLRFKGEHSMDSLLQVTLSVGRDRVTRRFYVKPLPGPQGPGR
jgi:hypothetical protein